MVRYPRHERQTLAGFDNIRVRTGNGAERPITELADIQVNRGYSQITRLDQLRAITITADVDEVRANASDVTDEMQTTHIPAILKNHPGVSVRWEGQAEQTAESIEGLIIGLIIALVAMFALLTLEFRSYVQPLLILVIIPFGFVGAVVGHLVLHLPLTLFSLFGLVALTGVVVNDSIVLIDFINHRVRDNLPLKEALIDAGGRRLRAVLLTSLTTIAGLLPIMLERSLQAQVVIPMATSLAFGLLFTTVLVLFLVPTFYYLYARLMGIGADAVQKHPASVPPPVPHRHLELEEDELKVVSP
jgi:multidrug efflux pump subunit AcrB